MTFLDAFNKIGKQHQTPIIDQINSLKPFYKTIVENFKSLPRTKDLLMKAAHKLRLEAGEGATVSHVYDPSTQVAWDVWRFSKINSALMETIPIAVLILATQDDDKLKNRLAVDIEFYAENIKLAPEAVGTACHFLSELPSEISPATIDDIASTSHNYALQLPYLGYNDVLTIFQKDRPRYVVYGAKLGDAHCPDWWISKKPYEASYEKVSFLE